MRNFSLRPSIHVWRPVETDIYPNNLEMLADSYGIRGVHITPQEFLGATIINSGEILKLYDVCETELSVDDRDLLGRVLDGVLPASADEYEDVPLSMDKVSRRTRKGLEYSIIASPSRLAAEERTVLKAALLDHMVDCVGGLAVAEVALYDWQPQTAGVQLARSYDAEAIDSFYNVLQERADIYLPDVITYEAVTTDNVTVRRIEARHVALGI